MSLVYQLIEVLVVATTPITPAATEVMAPTLLKLLLKLLVHSCFVEFVSTAL